MSNLNSLFDVVRGWPGTDNDSATITETFKPSSGVPANDPLVEGSIVFQQSDGTVDRASAADYSGAADVAALADLIAEAKQFWLVVDGNDADQYDTQIQTGAVGANGTLSYQPWKVTCIRGTYMVQTTNVVDRSYSQGDTVTVVSGQPDIIDSGGPTNQGFRPYGEVHDYNSSTGLLTLSV